MEVDNCSSGTQASFDDNVAEGKLQESSGGGTNAESVESKTDSSAKLSEPAKQMSVPLGEEFPRDSMTKVVDEVQCRFNVDSFKMVFIFSSESFLQSRMALKRARQSHRRISEKLNQKFHNWHSQWLQKFVSEEMQKKTMEWMLCSDDATDSRTLCIAENLLSKPPYHSYNRYRLQKDEEKTR